MGTCLPLILCCSLSLNSANSFSGQTIQASNTESNETVVLRSVQSMFLEGVLFGSGKSDVYSAVFEFSNEGVPQINDPQPGYVLEYLYPSGESIKTTCLVQGGLAWAPRNDKDVAHSWCARVPSNRQGIGYRILKGGQVVSEHRFTMPTNSIQIDCGETQKQDFTWHVHAKMAEIAISYDHGRSWQTTPAMRSAAGTVSIPSSQLQLNPNPWILLQGSANGVIYTKLYVFGLLRPS